MAVFPLLQNLGVGSNEYEEVAGWGDAPHPAAPEQALAPPQLLGQAAWPSIGQDQEDADMQAALQVGSRACAFLLDGRLAAGRGAAWAQITAVPCEQLG